MSPVVSTMPRGGQARRLNVNVRRGISLLEVLISIFVLSIGVLGVAALIPIGKLAMIETNKSDRTGACGRAILRDVKVRRMLDPNNWAGGPADPDKVFVIDPLGINKGLGVLLGGPGGVQRINLQTYLVSGPGTGTAYNILAAESIFLWRDDLAFGMPEDASTGARPVPSYVGTLQNVDGNFSWFLTVAASPGEAGVLWLQRRQYAVSAVVCYKRLFTTGVNDPNVGEQVITPVTCDSDPGYGGIGIDYPSNTVIPKKNEWVLLNSAKQTSWYRVVSAGSDGTDTRATLVGPDWHGGLAATLVVVDGVTGVYTTTVQLDDDGVWTK